jgi:hypothetical protein
VCSSDLFSNDNLNANYGKGGNVVWAATNLMDGQKHAMIEWEVTLLRKEDSQLCFGMGYMQSSAITNMVDNWLGHARGHEGCVYIHTTHSYPYFTIICDVKGNTKVALENEKTKPELVKIGDRFEIRFDFKLGKTDFYYNGEFIYFY